MKQIIHKNYYYFPRLQLNTKEKYYYHFECLNDYFGVITGFFHITIRVNNKFIKIKWFVQFSVNNDQHSSDALIIDSRCEAIEYIDQMPLKELIASYQSIKFIFEDINIKIDILKRPSY